jgi:hypothetical protein
MLMLLGEEANFATAAAAAAQPTSDRVHFIMKKMRVGSSRNQTKHRLHL